MNLQTEAQNISARLLSTIRVFAYSRDDEIEVHDQLFIDDNLKYLGTYDQWMTEEEVFGKLDHMVKKLKEMKSSENTL